MNLSLKPLHLCTEIENKIVPKYFTTRDFVWLDYIVNEFKRFHQRPEKELLSHFLSGVLPIKASKQKVMLAIKTLLSWCEKDHRQEDFFEKLERCSFESSSFKTMKELRRDIFMKSASFYAAQKNVSSFNSPHPSNLLKIHSIATWEDKLFSHVLSASPYLKKTSQNELKEILYTDLPDETRYLIPDTPINLHNLIHQANLILVKSLLLRSIECNILLLGHARQVVRYAKLAGLICVIKKVENPKLARHFGSVLSVSGPLSILHLTTIYGRRFAALIPLLTSCLQFKLKAKILFNGNIRELVVTSEDPITCPHDVTCHSFDSKIEKMFFEQFSKHAQSINWLILREPEPIPSGDTIIFPDFVCVHRLNPEKKWYLEIVGFWTHEYLQSKIKHYQEANIKNLILCVSEKLRCDDLATIHGARLVYFKSRIDITIILSILS